MKRARAIFFVLAFLPSVHASDDWLDQVERWLTFSTPRHELRGQVSGTLDLEGYRGDQSTTGFVFAEGDLFNPRLSLFLDAQQGRNWYAFAQARLDRGFDPSNGALRFRLDEYAVRWMIARDGHANLQVGQFATIIGGWIGRHLSWDNPFIGAPLPYAHMTGIYDRRAPTSLAALIPGRGEGEYEHNPIIWGPSYTTGVAIFGHSGRLDYAAEIKNVGPSSRPESWPVTVAGFECPAYNARIGWRPDPRWKLGFSFSDSSYLLPTAARAVGFARGDYRERLLGQDVSFAWHHWQVWAELFETKFTVPRAGAARTYAGYVEMRYKFTPQLFGALRWNRQVFSRVPDSIGSRQPWGEDVWRVDAAGVYRMTPHAQFKLQASGRREASRPNQLLLSYAGQFTVRF